MSKTKKLNVGVIFGGRSGEHEVSIVSAESIIKALNPENYEVIPIGITKNGQWFAGSKAIEYLKEGVKKLPFKSLLLPDPEERGLISLNPDSGSLAENEAVKKLDIVFPVIHGTFGEDGCLQGLLELANLPYVGCGVLGSALGLDKIIQKDLFVSATLPAVEYIWFLTHDWDKNQKEIIKLIEAKLAYPMFSKPANAGSSLGINKCRNLSELITGINEAKAYDRKVIIEQGLEDIREIEVAVLGNDSPRASVCGEIVASNEFYDYDAKYIDGQSEAFIPADLPESVAKQIREYAILAFKTLDLSGMARVDFLVKKENNQIYLNEVNTIPGFTSVSMYPKLWQATGLAYPDLLDELINLALARHEQKNRLLTSYRPKEDWYK